MKGDVHVRRGPVISTDLYDPNGIGLFKYVSERIDRTFAIQRDALASWFEDALRDSYMTGLQDGYAQGAADKHHNAETARLSVARPKEDN